MKMVTKVIDYKLLNGKRYYKVKWECTWEQEDNLHHCQDLVQQFWSFINRVKSEDDPLPDPVPVRKKLKLDDRNNIQCLSSNTNDTVESNTNSYTTILPCVNVQKKQEWDHSNTKCVQRNGNLHKLQKFTSSYLHGNDDSGGDNSGTTRKANMPIGIHIVDNAVSNNKPTKIVDSQTNVINMPIGIHNVDNAVSNNTSSKIVDVQQQKKQHDFNISRRTESLDEIHTECIETVPSGAPDLPYVQNQNDMALHWKNPYVGISFMCRICNEEQPFTNNNKKWKKHFLTHVQGSHQEGEEEEEEDLSVSSLPEEASSDDMAFIEDPERPWIQRVEYIIQKWGVSQYVRLVFSCRVCGKEQQASHTGNWRNHYNSHQDSRPQSCKKCSKIFRSRNSLAQHLKDIHNETDGRNVSHSCFVCGNDFNRKLDMRRHIALVHNIDPKTISLPGDGENRAILNIINKAIHPQKNNQTQTHKDSTSKDNLRFSDSELPNEMQTSPSKGEVTKKSCNSPSNDFSKINVFKHTCGICQQRFRKKIDLKCHTIDVHCIDINQSTRNDESLFPSMVVSGEIDTFKNQSCSNEFIEKSVDNNADARIIVNTINQLNTDNVEILIQVKEERMSSDDEEICGSILTIDEKECSDT